MNRKMKRYIGRDIEEDENEEIQRERYLGTGKMK